MFDWLSSVGSAVSSAFSSVAGSITSGVSAIAETVSPQKWSQIGKSVMEDIQKAAGYPRGRVDESEIRKPPQAAPTRKHIPAARPSRRPSRTQRSSKVHRSDTAKRAYYRKHGTSTLRKAGVDLSKRALRHSKPKVLKPELHPPVQGIHSGIANIIPLPEIRISFPESPEVRKPIPRRKSEIKLPVIKIETKEKPFTVQNPIDVIIEARNKAYEIGASEAAEGFRKGDVVKAGVGAGVFAGTAAADVALPLDLANVTNKVLTGRVHELDLEDWLWAGVDALAIGAGVLTAGLGYAGVKGLKAALKGTKVVGEAGKVAKEIGKAGKIVSEAGEVGKVLKGVCLRVLKP